MPTETVEPPITKPEYVPPQMPHPVQEPLKVKAGEKWKTEFDKLTKAEAGKPETPPVESPKDEPKAPVTPVPTEAKPEVKPTSPLDVVTAGKKEVQEEPDVLEGFDEKNPDWKRAREVMKTQRQEKKALEATIAELKKAPKSDPEEIIRLTKEKDELKQSLAEREELIQSVDVRLSKDYRDALQKRDTKISKVSTKAKAYGADADALIGALTLPDGAFKTQQIKAAMAEVDPEDKTEIRLLIGEVDTLNDQLTEFEKDAPKKYQEIQSKRETQLREQQEASVKNIHAEFGKITDALPTDIVTLREVPDDVPGGTEWNEAIKSAKENALRILSPGGSDFNESASVAYKGAHYDALMNMFLKDHAELVDARQRLNEYDSSGPDFRGGGKPKSEPKLTPAAKYHQTLEKIKSSPTD